jgi:hypothetical protein
VGGDFRITYRTLVKLLESGNANKIVADTGGDNWQVSEYTTTCKLTSQNRVSCRDEKGVVRDYSR